MSEASPSTQAHRAAAAERGPVTCAIITASDTRTPETDTSGRTIREQLEAAGHQVVFHEIVRDEPSLIEAAIHRIIATTPALAILINGGTGIAKRDTTYDAVTGLLEKTLPGFGEIFRVLSYEQVGPAAMLSRATAGVYSNRLIFSMPGSTNAVKLALEKLIVPELDHLVWEILR